MVTTLKGDHPPASTAGFWRGGIILMITQSLYLMQLLSSMWTMIVFTYMVMYDKRLIINEIVNDINISLRKLRIFCTVNLAWRRFLFDRCYIFWSKSTSWGNMTLFKAEPAVYLESFITQDGGWDHHFQPQTKRQSLPWKHPYKPSPKKHKFVSSAVNVMTSYFFGCKRNYVYCVKGHDMNVLYQRLRNLRKAIGQKTD